jgi:HK97 family phage major capsid protein
MEYRDVLAKTAGYGQEVVKEDKLSLLPYLRANSVLINAGANLLSGLVGDISIPILGTGATATWSTTEVSAALAAGQGFGEKTMSPKRITAYYDVSKQFLQQDSVNASAMLQADLMAAVNDLFEATVLGTAVGSATQPAGLFYTPTYAFTGTTTWAGIVSMESAVAANNALKSKASYIIHPTTLGVAKTTAKAANNAIFIAEGNSINGYPFYTSTNMPTVLSTQKAALFGCFNDLVIGQWGGLDLTIDPYSRSLYSQVRIVINFYVDCISRRDASFAKAALS